MAEALAGRARSSLTRHSLSSISRRVSIRTPIRFSNCPPPPCRDCLKPRAPVKSAGVVVGRVGEIGFDDKTYQAIVTLDLSGAYQFPKDSSAKILTSGLLGEQYIGLEPGGDTNNLAAGDRIKMTQSAIVLENLISQFLFSQAAQGKDESP